MADGRHMSPAGEPPPAQPGGVQAAGGLTVEDEVRARGVTGLKRCGNCRRCRRVRQVRRRLSAAVFVCLSSAAGSARTVTSLPSAHARSPTTCAGVPGAARYHQSTRFEVRELGEIDMVSVARATLEPADTGTGSW